MKIRFFTILFVGYFWSVTAQIRFTPALVYQNIAEKGYVTQEVVTRLANYYYALQQYPNALPWYEKLITTVGYNPAPIDYYHYARTLKELGKEKEAQLQLNRFEKSSQFFLAELAKKTPAPSNPNNTNYKELIGKVTDAEKGTIIQGATITLGDAQMNPLRTNTSDSDGSFLLSSKQSESTFKYGYLEIVKPAYEVITIPLIFDKPAEKQMIIQLPPLVQDVEAGDNLATTFDIDNIHFDYGRLNIRYDASVQLSKILAFLEMNPSVSLDIRVHTDNRGDYDYNMKLSEDQARSIWQWLVDRGVSSSRVKSKGYGATQPVNDCEDTPCTEEQYQLNKRVEFIIR